MIREIDKNDVESFELLAKNYKENFNSLYNINNIIENNINKIYIYEINNIIAGFIFLEYTYETVSLLHIYVLPEYRNKHIATSLINFSIEQLNNVDNMILEVNVNNIEAINLYKKNGFKIINTRKKYYDGIDAYVMERKINMNSVKILAIESSCDETSIAIVENGTKVLSLATNTQIAIHASYGGVVPEIASRMHTENILYVFEEALLKSNITMDEIDAIAVTYGPGLMGSLLVGVEFAKTLSLVYNKPLIAVNHLIGHIYANNIESKLKFPLLSLVVSGGHTELLLMEDDLKFKLLGRTLDDAIGESYDKVAKVLGIPYPGGPNIEKLAKTGNCTYDLPTPVNDETFNFSYSGLKSAVINIVNNEKQRGNEIRPNDLAASFQIKAVDEVCRKVDLALSQYKVNQLVVAGGVSANQYLKNELNKVCEKYNVDLKIPSIIYCTDNAAMIGAAAYQQYIKKDFASLDLNANSGLNICD